MRITNKIPGVIGTLIIAALLVIAVSGYSNRAHALEGTIDGQGILVADLDNGDIGDEEFEIEGTIESLTDTGIVVDGQEIIIDETTEIEGILAVGTMVEVEALVQDDGSLLALEVEVEDGEEVEEE